jgi:hypothetical protein
MTAKPASANADGLRLAAKSVRREPANGRRGWGDTLRYAAAAAG